MKKIVSLFTVVILLCAFCVSAAAELYIGGKSNKNAHEYPSYSTDVINSYITETSDGYMELRYDTDRYYARYYGKNFHLNKTVEISKELPFIGGFYSDGDNYYLVTGNMNAEENDSIEVFRVTKYDLDWKRLGSAGFYGENTYIPFTAGTVRMVHNGGKLYVHTCHEMYASSDGLHHQANVTLVIDTDTMTKEREYTGGYVSHSLNQFVIYDDEEDTAVFLDQGDANPRSAYLYRDDIKSGVSMISFADSTKTHYNYTKATLGGLAASRTQYIVAGTTVNQNDYDNCETQNIFISTVSKDLSVPPFLTMITDYPEGSESASVPYLVKVSDGRFILMWTHDDKLYYTELDEFGNRTGTLYEADAELSDCEPLVTSDNKILWYVYEDSRTDFYTIDLNDLSKTDKISTFSGHLVKEIEAPQDGFVSAVCTDCGKKLKFSVPDKMDVTFNRITARTQNYTSSSQMTKSNGVYYVNVGDEIQVNIVFPEKFYGLGEQTVYISNPDMLDYYIKGELKQKFIKVTEIGECTVEVYPEYNPSIKETFTFRCLPESTEITSAKLSDSKRYITLKWDSAAGAENYTVYQYNGREETAVKTTSSTSAKISVKSGEEYRFAVAVNINGASSKLIYGDTITIPNIKPVVKSSVQSTSKGFKVTLTWNKVEDAEQYRVYNLTNGKLTLAKTTDKTSVSFDGLKSGRYRFVVTAKVGGIWSVPSKSDAVTVNV